MKKFNYYEDQDSMLTDMSKKPALLVKAPTGTGKGHIMEVDASTELPETVDQTRFCLILSVSHRILLSSETLSRITEHAYNNGNKPFMRMSVHSGGAVEYSKFDAEEDKIWLESTPDLKCMSISSIKENIEKAIQLNQPLLTATTYYSVGKFIKACQELNVRVTVAYLDEIQAATGDTLVATTSQINDISDRIYGFTATPGPVGSKIRKRIQAILGTTETSEFSLYDAIARARITKPRWIITTVNGDKKRDISQGVIKEFKGYKLETKNDVEMLVHTGGTDEIESIVSSAHMNKLIKDQPNSLIADISSMYGPRIRVQGRLLCETELKKHIFSNGKTYNNSRQAWLRIIKEHNGPKLVIHIDICNAGIDIPNFEFGLWTYVPTSEIYALQAIGRTFRICQSDRQKLEKNLISTKDYTVWEKPYNNVGLLIFNDTPIDAESEFIGFIIKMREMGFEADELIYTPRTGGEQENKTVTGHKQRQVEISIVTCTETFNNDAFWDDVTKIDINNSNSFNDLVKMI